MWWITLIIDAFLVMTGFIFCRIYYKRNYGSELEFLSLELLRMHETLHGKIYGVMPDFMNYSFNILLKGIVTGVCILVVHFTDTLWLTYLFAIYLLLTYWVFSKRLKHYRFLGNEIKYAIRPALVASFTLPFYHTLFYGLIFLAYYLNK